MERYSEWCTYLCTLEFKSSIISRYNYFMISKNVTVKMRSASSEKVALVIKHSCFEIVGFFKKKEALKK